jgi:hypothetical protein
MDQGYPSTMGLLVSAETFALGTPGGVDAGEPGMGAGVSGTLLRGDSGALQAVGQTAIASPQSQSIHLA